MKIRTGFVSNSSSSSYVVIIPDDFDVVDYVYSKIDAVNKIYEQDYGNRARRRGVDPEPFEFVQNLINILLLSINNGRDARGHRVGRCFTPDDMDYTTYYAIESVFRDLIIAQAEAGSNNGSITLVLEKEINAKIAEVQARLNIPEGKGKRMLMIDEFVKKEEEKKIRKQKLKDIHKEVDPHGEEEWED